MIHRSMVAGALLAALGAGAAAMAAPVKVPGFAYVRSLEGVDEYRLESNGLNVLIYHDDSAPVALFNVVYYVGSRNEVTGTTGATHLLEHLMFKGSDAYNDARGNSVKQYLERVGGQFNATTSVDRTNYYALLGSRSLADYVAIEADRMRNLWLHESDRQAEMTVVRNEFEIGKNDPGSLLIEEVTATAFQAQPYHHSTIGWKSDIENVPIEKLREFYDAFYWPNNAMAIVAGDVPPERALQLVKQSYGGFSRSPRPVPAMYTREPAQSGPRRVIVKHPGQLGQVVIAHKVPEGRHPDMAALAVLDMILVGGKSSRMYKALVDKGLALDALSMTIPQRDPSLQMLIAALAPGATHEAAEKAMRETVETIKREGVSAAELDRVKQQQQALAARRRDGVGGVVGELNEWAAAGDWTLFATRPRAIQNVTAADVQRVARAYCNEDQSTTGWFVPTRK